MLHLPVRSADLAALGWTSPMYREVIEHPAFDAFWRAISTKEQIDKVKVPVFSVGGWYDNFVQSDLEAFAILRKRNGVNRILVGPWAHNMSLPFADVNFGEDSSVPVRSLQMEWFDQWLMGKDSPLLSNPPVKIFVMGSNVWRVKNRRGRAPEAHQQIFYRRARERRIHWKATARSATNRRAIQRQTSSSSTRTTRCRPAAARWWCCNPKVFPWGPMDQRPVEQRKDVWCTPPNR